ncbi:MAG TPA: Ig-like domain repeat protein [Terriglobia bacterium]|nr:Ig-like domain repeat protein [Terriglobia bacterium]
MAKGTGFEPTGNSRLSRLLAAQILALIFLFPFKVSAQTSRFPPRITQAVDLQKLVTLHGNTHPLARPEYDHGAAPDSLPLDHMLLVLERGPEQETALRQLLDAQQEKPSPSYHQWLTPTQFGKQFGLAESDIQAVSDWLTSQGFNIDQVTASRTIIEFSGTAGQVRQALHTEIHRYVVNGKGRWANDSDPQIPAALSPVVAGIASLNNFRRKPLVHRIGTFSRSKATGEVRPLFTYTSTGQTFHALGPADFATIYNIQPLWQAGTDGAGQTIAIVAQSNINIQDARDFRTLFGLPANDPQIILNGPDPGIVSGDEGETDLDMEWAGAVARNATIDVVVSETTETSAGIDLSALYIIDNNIAPVMSESYGGCEAGLGVAGNAFYSTLWEQAAAQGITVLISAGDNGSAGCDGASGQTAARGGLAINGFASTPFDVAVGGTDFDDATTSSKYWSAKNNSLSQSSALSYIPEMTWNDSCAQSGLKGCAIVSNTGQDLVAGGGGPSTCGVLTGTDPNATCVKGYAKPSWQTGIGVPSDGERDTPDVSMFAADGLNGSFYIVCQADANLNTNSSCNLNSPYQDFQGVGGTSASTQVFGGIMALINQKTSARQGNANYVLYKLAAQNGASCASNSAAVGNTSCIFYDVITGNNSVACQGGSTNCSNGTSGGYGVLVAPGSPSTPAWTTTAGYDLATGLGTVNAANLVNKWSSVSFKPSTTTLTLSPATLTHGQPVNVTIQVTAQSGTPTGTVALEGGPNNASLGLGAFTLTNNGTVSGATSLLPGGTYTVTAHYGGDENYGASSSSPPIPVTVSKESSETQIGIVTFGPSGNVLSNNATVFAYGSPYVFRANVTNGAGTSCEGAKHLPVSGCPTGSLSLTDGGKPLDLGTYTLNSLGYLEDVLIQLLPGTHILMAAYAGDNSFNASSSPQDAVTVTQAATGTSLTANPPSVQSGNTVTLTAVINTQSNGVAPSGTVQFLNGSTPVSGNVVYTPTAGSAGPSAQLQATLATTLSATANITASYSGDSNYLKSASTPVTVTVVPGFNLSASPTNLTITAPGQSATSSLTVTPGGGFTGVVSFSCLVPVTMKESHCSLSPSSLTKSGNTTLTVSTTAASGGVGLFGNGPGTWNWVLLSVAVILFGWLLLGRLAARRRFNWAFGLLLLFLVATAFAGCGSGSSSPGTTSRPGTPAGTYTVPVTATGGTISHSVNFTVTVQ